MMKRIIQNKNVRATLIVGVITLILGLLQANISGPLWLLSLAGVYLGTFLTIILICVSLVSVIKDMRNSSRALVLKPEVLPGTAAYYKRGLRWSLVIAFPGLFMWLTSIWETRGGRGGGEAFIIFIPLMFLSFVMVIPILFYGFMYLYKRSK